jgi:hypothetical protein
VRAIRLKYFPRFGLRKNQTAEENPTHRGCANMFSTRPLIPTPNRQRVSRLLRSNLAGLQLILAHPQTQV